jgi:DNA polymerase-1
VLAHLCGDPRLMAAFESDQDIHRTVAAEVFEVPPDEVTPDQRAKAKTVNFGIVYGQTAFGLSRTLRIRRSDAQDFIARYHRRFPRIHEFLRACVAKAKADGYVETVSGRRRKITELDSSNAARRAAAERLAINSVVQGSAADLIKRAMVNIDARIRREARPSRMLIQIHDELVFDIPKGSIDDERRMIVEEMTGAITLRVPLKVDTGVGANWMDAK